MPFIKYFWWYFNSQPHKEADKLPPGNVHEVRTFQLTASQGGWPGWLYHTFLYLTFQLTASQGGWPSLQLQPYPSNTFQLTASQGGWRKSGERWRCSLKFQLTASQGGWRHRNVLSAYNFISTHSLTRRLTDNFLWVTFILEVFQLTASQGGWRIRIIPLIRVMWISTHSLTRRLTVVMAKDVWCSWYFNSQPHKEADTHVCFVYVRGGHFNSQPHKEADQLSHSQLHNLKYISTHSLTRRLTAV